MCEQWNPNRLICGDLNSHWGSNSSMSNAKAEPVPLVVIWPHICYVTSQFIRYFHNRNLSSFLQQPFKVHSIIIISISQEKKHFKKFLSINRFTLLLYIRKRTCPDCLKLGYLKIKCTNVHFYLCIYLFIQ